MHGGGLCIELRVGLGQESRECAQCGLLLQYATSNALVRTDWMYTERI